MTAFTSSLRETEFNFNRGDFLRCTPLGRKLRFVFLARSNAEHEHRLWFCPVAGSGKTQK
jgi:hypothetical protein